MLCAPGFQEVPKGCGSELATVVTGKIFWDTINAKVLLEALDEITAGSLPGVCHRQDLSTVLALGPVLFRCAHTKLAAGCFVKLSSH